MLELLCNYLPVIFARIFVKSCDFYTGNAVQFSIRSDPFFEVFLKDLSSKVDMHVYWTITYAYTVVLVSNFAPNSRIFEPKCGPVLVRSIPFNSE